MNTSPSVKRSVSSTLRSVRSRSRLLGWSALSLALLTGGVASAADQDVSGSINYTSSISVPSGQTVQVAAGAAFNATYSLRATATGYSDAITFSVMAQKGAGPAYVTILSQKCVGTPLLVNPRVLESGSGTAMHLVITVNVPASVTLVGGATGTQTNLALSTSLPTFDTPSVTTISTVLSSYNGTMGVGTPYPQTTLQVTAGGNVGGAGGEIGISANFDRAPMFTIKGSLLGTGSGGDSGDIYFKMRSADNVALAPVMTFLRNGNIGIGTSTPGVKLEVAGGTKVNGDLEVASGGELKVAAGKLRLGGTIFNPGDYLLATGGGALSITTVTASGAITSSGAITASGILTAGGGTLTGSSSTGLTITAGAANKDIVFAPTGTGATLFSSGNVGIGITTSTYMTSANGTPYKLSVEGKIHAKEVVIDTDSASWSDYVFADNYRNAPLAEVEQHIREHRHLPGIPSAREVEEKGVSVGKMQALLLAKVEELTLHLIEQEKSAKAQALRLGEQESRLQRLEQENAALRASRE